MSKNVSFSLGGQTVMWQSGSDVDSVQLTMGLIPLGLSDYIPETATEIEALKMAVAGFDFRGSYKFSEKTIFALRPLVGEEGYTLVAETSKGKGQGNKTENMFLVYPDKTLQMYPGDSGMAPPQEIEDGLRRAYQNSLGCVPSERVTKSLTALVAKFDGIPLLKGRGRTPYWIPQKNVADWEAAVAVFEGASRGDAVQVFPLNVVMDEAAVRTVTFALSKDIEQKLGKIEDRIDNSDPKTGKELGRVGRRNMTRNASTMLEQVERYEEILGTALKGVREQFKPVAESLSAAELLEDLGI